ncbi:MAG: carboxymuconolactone decarboxylase family protein [Ignavibacteriaceae bacterium]|jgi:4-carboxymuconolactone decarboxylase
MINTNKALTRLKARELLPLIAVSAVLRKYESLEKLIKIAKLKKVSFKKMYEVLLQNYLFAGYPSAILSLKILKEVYPSKKLPKAEDMNLYHFMNKGIKNCKKVYGDKFEKLIYNIRDFSPDLAEWLVFEGYGKVLGRRGLSFKERELCIVGVLTALEFNDQLYSHINGAYKARASIHEIIEVIENINLIGNKELVNFGLAVVNKFKKDRE